jgi:hypothetical protein
MGEIADMLINGEQCSHCGVCFHGEHGYPVLCRDCFKDDMQGRKKRVKMKRTCGMNVGPSGIPKATIREYGD